MKIYIFEDMEGVSGISGSEFVTVGGRHYQTGRRYYTEELNACVRGCFKAGAEAVLARDGHGSGDHLIWDALDSRVEVFQGRNDTGSLRFPRIQECDALILLGYHAMAGTRGALLEHTYSSKSFQNMWLNGRLVGEAGLDAAIAADYGVPTILVTGDDAVCREAREWIPGVVTCQVKQSFGCQGSFLLPRETSHRMIEDATVEAIRRLPDIKPLHISKPVTWRVEVVERGAMPHEGEDDLLLIDGRTYARTGDSALQARFGRQASAMPKIGGACARAGQQEAG